MTHGKLFAAAAITGMGVVVACNTASAASPSARAQPQTAAASGGQASAAVLPVQGLPAAIEERLQTASLPLDAMGVAVIRVRDGRVTLAHGERVAMQPASTMKTLSAIVALDTLGPAHRWRAELRTSGVLKDGVLSGDLVLQGRGSVDLDMNEFERLLRRLRDAGVREIRGDVIVDRHFFNPSRLDVGVPPFDDAPEFRYNLIPDALLLNMNLVEYRVVSDDKSFTIRMTPALPNVNVISNMTFNDAPCTKWEDTWKIPTTIRTGESNESEIRIYLQGQFPKNCAQTMNLNLIDRADFVARAFQSRWAAVGGVLTGQVREAAAAIPVESSRLLAAHSGRPLAEVARDINKVSDNTFTRMALLHVGARAEGEGTTLQKADAASRAWLRANGVDDTGIVIDNGSGLSRTERISPLQLAQVLHAAAKSKWAPEFLSSLPIVGVDGSMRGRLQDSPAAQVSRIKTGSLRNVVSVAGYVPDANGEMHAVVAMINHDRAIAAGGRAILDAMLDWVARSK
jgi:serine-type D-Ala-D-Ala carboxypeptidase/endopeptidase (penicillin-binding protein 4)